MPQCPTFKREADAPEVPEPFAAEAKFFTESRLLQRDVQIVLESCHNQNILGTILHPASGGGEGQEGGHWGLRGCSSSPAGARCEVLPPPWGWELCSLPGDVGGHGTI